MAPLEHAGWRSDEHGEVVNGLPQRRRPGGGSYAVFKHAQELKANDVLRMRVEVGGDAGVGFAGAGFDVERAGDVGDEETADSTAWVSLCTGTMCINTNISQDGQDHYHSRHFRLPEAPFDLALRCEAVSNVPQIQFKDDGVWYDFAPDRVALKAGPWFPYLFLGDYVRLIDHRVDRPRATKSAGKTIKAPAAPFAASADGAGAGAAADGEKDDSASPPQKKARRDECDGSQ